MTPQNDVIALASFRVWLDHQLGDELQAYRNQSVNLYEIDDDQYSKTVYSAPLYQMVYDASISGASVITGVYNGATHVNRGTSGLIIDFENGRALFNSGAVENQTLTMSGAFKEINTYITTKSEERLLNELKFDQEPNYQSVTGNIAPNQVVLPAIFIRPIDTENEPFCFGGQDMTEMSIRCVCFGSDWQVINIGSMLRDLYLQRFPHFDPDDLPLDEYGDVKAAFSYDATVSGYSASESFWTVHSSEFLSYENDNISKNNPNLRVGFGEIKIRRPRFPRQ
jgi:hypothetical protein